MDLEEGINHLDLHDAVISAPNVTNPQDKRNPVTECFSNSVIMDCLLQYLGHSSKKMFSQSCHSVLSLIRSNRGFIDKSIFCIGASPGANYHSMWPLSKAEREKRIVDLAFLQNVNFPWTSMRIAADYLDNVGIGIVTNLLSRVIRLDLSKCSSTRGIEEFKGHIHILQAAESLKELVIDDCYFWMDEVDRKMFMSNPKVQTIVEHLDVLHIKSDEREDDYYGQLTFSLNKRETVKALVAMPKYLRSFSFQCERTKPEFVQSLLMLLLNHVNTLVSLDLHHWAWHTDEVLDLVCPNLRELNIISRGQELPRVCQFIMKQGQLLKLDVNLFCGSILSPTPLFDTLTLRGSQLIAFSLTWMIDAPRAQPHAPRPSLDFSWLQNLSNLKSITIRQFCRDNWGLDTVAPVSHILANLPDGIESITCTGASPRSFFCPADSDSEKILMIENLGRFRDLKALNLLECGNTLNDDILLFISSNLSNLRELGFTSCDITEIGLTGVGALKGLVKLKVYNCRNLLEKNEILQSFIFPELKELHMERNDIRRYHEIRLDKKRKSKYHPTLNADYFKKIISRNRMLEKLVLEDYDPTLEDVLKEYFGRIIRVAEINSYAPFRDLEDRTSDTDEDDN